MSGKIVLEIVSVCRFASRDKFAMLWCKRWNSFSILDLHFQKIWVLEKC